MRANIKSILIPVFLLCLGLLASGCQTVLSVRPGDTTIVHGDPVDVIVAVANDSAPNKLVIKGSAPKTIGIKSRKGGSEKWSQPVPVSLIEGQYAYTFENVEEDLDYMIDVAATSAGPFKIKVEKSDEYEKGYKLAGKHQNQELPGYRLVIELHSLSPSGRQDFLRGFIAAYAEINDSALGKRYASILRESLAGDHYDRSLEEGKKHVNWQVTDAQIQALIRRSFGISRAVTLGWKAGYIEGFNQEKLRKALSEGQPEIKREAKNYYQQAEAMYEALRAGAGL